MSATRRGRTNESRDLRSLMSGPDEQDDEEAWSDGGHAGVIDERLCFKQPSTIIIDDVSPGVMC
jgi:hypothetical protein